MVGLPMVGLPMVGLPMVGLPMAGLPKAEGTELAPEAVGAGRLTATKTRLSRGTFYFGQLGTFLFGATLAWTALRYSL